MSLYNETLDWAGQPQPIPDAGSWHGGVDSDLTRVCGQAWQSKGFNLSPSSSPLKPDQGDVGVFRYLATIHDTVAGYRH